MSFDAQNLYELLPAIVRIRDAEEGGPLRALLGVIAEQSAVLEENLAQSYDDQFIETCADWVVPYIGDLVGYRSLHGVVPAVANPRAEVANTIAFRRRKGTATMLEQLAQDVTGWPARVVEFFELLAATQYMNHLRPKALYTPDLRDWQRLEHLGTAFDNIARTLELRRIVTGSGRYHIPNIGIFLWRLRSQELRDSPAVPTAAGDQQRFLFSPLGNDTRLFSKAEREPRITNLAKPQHVPMPLSRRVLERDLRADDSVYYGAGLSLIVKENGAAVPRKAVRICDLSEIGGGNWASQPKAGLAVDPVLGRLMFAQPVAGQVSVSFHTGFSAQMGGGSYERETSFAELGPGQMMVRVPGDRPTITAAIGALPATGGIVEITDNGRYEETIQIAAQANASIELRAANGRRPILLLPHAMEIIGGEHTTVTLNGLLIAAAQDAVPDPSAGVIRVPAAGNILGRLNLRHCTLVPGRALNRDGTPLQWGAASLIVECRGVVIDMDKCIIGGLRVERASRLEGSESIVDSGQPSDVAYAAVNDVDAGGEITLKECTVIGKISTVALELVSNSILFAELAGAGDPFNTPIKAERRQHGCGRFSFIPVDAIAPRRYRCQPDLEIASRINDIEQRTGTKLDPNGRDEVAEAVTQSLRPGFTSLSYGDPGYCQLRLSTPVQIRAGSDEEAEMGAFHRLYQPQRETNLRVRLEEYLRFGLEAGIFYET